MKRISTTAILCSGILLLLIVCTNRSDSFRYNSIGQVSITSVVKFYCIGIATVTHRVFKIHKYLFSSILINWIDNWVDEALSCINYIILLCNLTLF